MKTLSTGRLLGALALLLLALPAFAQEASPIGVWRTIDDETGEPKAHIEIYEEGGKLHGRILTLLCSIRHLYQRDGGRERFAGTPAFRSARSFGGIGWHWQCFSCARCHARR